MKKSRVIIIDDESDIREALQGWLSRDYDVHTFDLAHAFLNAVNNHKFEDEIPSCILLDFQMPGMTGIELQANLKKLNAKLPIIFMSGNALQADIIDAWQGGAVDFILKPFKASQVSEKLAKLFQLADTGKKSNQQAAENKNTVDIPITQREAQVLLLLGQGRQQHEVAQILNLSLRTVKMHRTAIKNKLNLTTLMELGRFCDEYHQSIKKIAAIN